MKLTGLSDGEASGSRLPGDNKPFMPMSPAARWECGPETGGERVVQRRPGASPWRCRCKASRADGHCSSYLSW